jgi:hypothetical protein
MKRTLIQYRTHPRDAETNQQLVEAVFAELASTKPEGVRYVVLRKSDATFYHLVMVDSDAAGSAIPKLDAFRRFQTGIRERCVEPPQPSDVVIVGAYRMAGA